MSENYSLIENTNPNTQMRLLATIFENKINIYISKSDLETEFVIRWLLRNTALPIVLTSIEESFEHFDKSPGDVQRQLRTFYHKFKDYGLTQLVSNKTPGYIYIPKLKTDCECIIRPAARNLFNTQSRKDFMNYHKNKCQLCYSNTRLAIDHWRAHSVYNIDDKQLAVLLCEKCNNIHHNFDASRCIEKNIDSIKYIQNWITIETNIRSLGFEPNEEDLRTQHDNMVKVNYYYDSLLTPLNIHFWKGLFHN